jgi:hypothetical protein
MFSFRQWNILQIYFEDAEQTLAWASLPCKLVDMVLDHVEPTISALLVSKYWYSKLIQQRFKDLQLSTSMVPNIQNLSKDTLAIMTSHSEDLSIVVSRGDQPATCHLGLSTFENDNIWLTFLHNFKRSSRSVFAIGLKEKHPGVLFCRRLPRKSFQAFHTCP